MKMIKMRGLFALAFAALLSPLFGACDKQALPAEKGYVVPEGMVEVRPVLAGTFGSIPRDASEVSEASSPSFDDVRSSSYPTRDETDVKLENWQQLPLAEGSTVWLIARHEDAATHEVSYTKKSYVVYNNTDTGASTSYLVPCVVDTEGKVVSREGSPFFLRNGFSYTFYAISPARALRDDWFASGVVGFPVRNGEAFYANDCRYARTTPRPVTVESTNSEAVQVVELSPMINQTALLRFRIVGGKNVHDLDIQPAGIQISGLQEDEIDPAAIDAEGKTYGNNEGLFWRMAQSQTAEPFSLQHGGKTDSFRIYDCVLENEEVRIDVPILPMYCASQPVIVMLRLKVNGVPTAFEMMLNEKDFKAGYSYGYRGTINTEDKVTTISWQFVNWEYEAPFPDFTK